ncbi:MAG TPA: c-type cytochrome domain-containing protein [Gemmataceae bacterium]|nr:c-type cytochrome domain-containing protein [Gemmataceae bacterium]
MTKILPYLCLVFSVPAVSLWFTPSSGAAEPTYWQDIRPVLRKHCTVCHSARNVNELEVSGGLALDSYEAVLKGTKQPVLHPGKSADSPIIRLLTTADAEKRMPLNSPPLPAETIDLIRRWIDAGAKEGQRPADDTTAIAARPVSRGRKLDVILATGTVPPQGALGSAQPAKLELALRVGPLAPVTAVAFSPDGKLLASGSYGRVVVWDLAAARPVKVLTNVLGAVNDVRFSPDGRLLAAAGGQPSAKGDLRLYQVSDWKLLAVLGDHLDVVSCVAFSPDGKTLASASYDKTVRLWDVAGHRLLQTLTGHSDFVYAVAFSPDGQWLVSASKDRSVKMVETAGGKGRFTFSGMNQDVLAVAVSPDGKQVVSSGLEPALYWWDAQTGQRLRVQGGHGGAVHEINFSKDGKLVVSGGADGTVRLWDGATGTPQRTLTAGSIVYAVAVSPDGRRMASGHLDGLVRLWDTASGRQLALLLALPPEGENADWLALTPEGYTAGSDRLLSLGQWRMAGQTVAADAVWQALRRPEAVAKAVRGEALPAPAFGK